MSTTGKIPMEIAKQYTAPARAETSSRVNKFFSQIIDWTLAIYSDLAGYRGNDYRRQGRRIGAETETE